TLRCLPEGEAPTMPRFVGDERRVRIEADPDLPGVTAADVEVIEVDEGPEEPDGLLEAPVPPPPPHPLAGGVPELLLVGLALPKGMVGKLEVGGEAAVEVERRAEAGSEGDDQLDASTPDDGQPLKVGVVRHPDGLPESAGQGAREVDALPARVTEVRRRLDAAVAHDSRKADSDTVVRGKGRDELRQRLDHDPRRPPDGRRHAHAVDEHPTPRIQDGGLEAGTADVDGEGPRPRGPATGAGPVHSAGTRFGAGRRGAAPRC